MKHIPNFITSLNLASGFLGIILILNGDLVAASWFILAAMVFDFMDGFIARALKAYSELGKELDSLADLVSFGVAPGLIIYKLLISGSVTGSFPAFYLLDPRTCIYMAVSAIMPVCAALRLARFNIDTTQETTFRGLPTPGNALAVISLVIGGYYSGSSLLPLLTGSPLFLIIFSICLSLIMVTRIPLLSLKFKNLKIKGNEGRYLTIIICAVMISIFGIGSFPVIIPVYIIVSLISLLF